MISPSSPDRLVTRYAPLNAMRPSSGIKNAKIGRAEVRKSGKAKDFSSHLSLTTCDIIDDVNGITDSRLHLKSLAKRDKTD
jgi:hypothetical protein